MGNRAADKVVLISGGAKGQGAADAQLFVAEGGSVVIGDILDDQGAALATALGSRAHYCHLDVRNVDDWDRAIAEGSERFGALSTLVNNAGILEFGGLSTPKSDYMRVIEINQVGCFLGMQRVAPHLAAAGGGSIVNIASTAGMTGIGNMIAYSASKWAIRGMTRGAAVELAPHGIRVNALLPGSVETDMLTQTFGDQPDPLIAASIPLGRAGTPEELAEAVLFLASDGAAYCTGQELVFDGGAMAGVMMPLADDAGVKTL